MFLGVRRQLLFGRRAIGGFLVMMLLVRVLVVRLLVGRRRGCTTPRARLRGGCLRCRLGVRGLPEH